MDSRQGKVTVIIAINDGLAQFIHEEVASGRFKNADEVVVASLRLFKRRQHKIRTLRTHLEAARTREGGAIDEELDEVLLELLEYQESKTDALWTHLDAALAGVGGYSDEELDEILLLGELPD